MMIVVNALGHSLVLTLVVTFTNLAQSYPN